MAKHDADPRALVVGRGPSAASAALELATAGATVTLLTADDWLMPGADGVLGVPALLEAARHPRIELLTGATVDGLAGNGSGLRVTIAQSPRWVDPVLCTACGACTEVCPVTLDSANGTASHTAIYRGGVPTTYAIDKAGTAPCRDACPIDQRAQGYTALIRSGEYAAAYRAISRDNPFPSVCGRICNHRCEDACSRAKYDAPVSVMQLKRFVSDWALENLTPDELHPPRIATADPSGKRVAVVGSGPAGLTCALDLTRQGHAVTVFEALPVAGGMMRVGVPDYRLPGELVQREVDEIVAEGVELVLNHRVDDVPGLLAEGFDAVFAAIGAHTGIKIPIPGSDLGQVFLATDFLRAVSLARSGAGAASAAGAPGAVKPARAAKSAQPAKSASLSKSPDPAAPTLGSLPSEAELRELIDGRRVLVLGGGNVAIDTAMTALRLGAAWVGMSCLESRETMPSHDWEVRDAEEEGIDLFPSRTFKEFTAVAAADGTAGAGQVTGVRCVGVDFRGFVDGRPDFDELDGTEEVIAADVVIWAIGQRPEIDCLTDEVAKVHGRFAQIDPATMATSLPGLFAGGDVVTGTAFVVDAIAAGRRAARSIDRYLQSEALVFELPQLPAVVLDVAEVQQRVAAGGAATLQRAVVHKRPAAERRRDFAEVYAALSEAEAQSESSRCLSCGFCSECLQCVDACPAGAIDHTNQARTLEIAAGALVWADSRAPITAVPMSPSQKLAGVFADGRSGDDASLTMAIDGALAHLGLARRTAEARAAAPARRLATNSGGGQAGVFLCRCGGEIERVVDLAAVAERVQSLPDVGFVTTIDFACHPEGHQALTAAWAEQGLDRAVLAACSCCALDQICYSCTTQRTRCKERLDVFAATGGQRMEFVNVREQCAFVHREDGAAATAKAGDLVSAAVAALAAGLPPDAASDNGSRGAFASRSNGWAGLFDERAPITAAIDPVRCRGCEDCEVVCGLDAVHVRGSNGTRLAQVDPMACAGCGVCVAVCSSGAITASDATDAEVAARLAAMGDLSDKTVVFSCNWGGYSAVEAAGSQRLQYDPSLRLIRLMCAGRAHPGLILNAFVQGAQRVLVVTCGHDGDDSLCRYHSGNGQARRSVELTQGMLAVLGIDPRRLTIAEMRPGDGSRFVAAVEECMGSAVGVGSGERI